MNRPNGWFPVPAAPSFEPGKMGSPGRRHRLNEIHRDRSVTTDFLSTTILRWLRGRKFRLSTLIASDTTWFSFGSHLHRLNANDDMLHRLQWRARQRQTVPTTRMEIETTKCL